MTPAQKRVKELRDRQSKERQRMAELSLADTLTDETRSELDTIEKGTPDLERQLRAAEAALVAEEASQKVPGPSDAGPDAESREIAEIRGKTGMRDFVAAALEMRGVEGAAAELNAALRIPAGRFPLELLAPPAREARAGKEDRTTTNTDAATTQASWLDRLFADTAASRLGITMQSVASGVSSHPVTTAGAAAAQRGRSEAASDASWTVGVIEMKPKRNAVRAVFSEEDAARLPGLEAALNRDLAMALTEGIDRAIFLGDAGANENAGDITGLTTFTAAATGLVEVTLKQADKVKGPETLALFAGMIDGVHAGSMADLNIIASVGANTLWLSTSVTSGTQHQPYSLARYLMDGGMSWGIRGGIDTATAANDFGAFVGRARGIEGAGVMAMWDSGQLIRDPYSNASKGEVALTLSTLWDFALPRPSSFRRLKFVA